MMNVLHGAGACKRIAAPMALAAVLVAAAAWSDRVAVRPGTIGGLDPAALFPAETLGMVSINGAPWQESGKELALGKIINEPEVQEFISGMMEKFHAGQEQMDAQLQQMGLSRADLEALGTTRVLFGVTRFEPPARGGMGPPSIDLMLAMDLRGRQEAFQNILKSFEQMLETMGGVQPTDVKIGGVPAKHVAVPGEADAKRPFSGVSWLVHEGWFLAGTSDAHLEQAMGRVKSGETGGSLVTNATYATAAQQVMRPKTVGSVYVGLKPIMAMIAAESPEAKKPMAAMGFDKLESVAFGLDLDGPGFRERLFLGAPADTFYRKLLAKIDAAKLLAMVPKGSFLAQASGLNMGEYYDSFTAMIEAQDEHGAKEMHEGIAGFEKAMSVKLREDVLANLGPEYAAFAAMPKSGLIPDMGVMIRVKDRAKIEGLIDRAIKKSKAKSAHGSIKWGETTINYIETGEMGVFPEDWMNFRPSYAFVGDYLLVTLWPQAAKNVISAMARKEGGLPTREDFARGFARLKAENQDAGNSGVGYLDTGAAASMLVETVIPILQTVVPGSIPEMDGLELNMAAFPSSEAICKHLFGTISTVQSLDSGIYTDYYSPMTITLPAIALGAGVAVGVRQEAMRSHVRTAPAKAGEKDEDDEDR